MFGRGRHRGPDHRGHRLLGNRGPTGRAGLVPPQTGDAGLQEAGPPPPHGGFGHAGATHGLKPAMTRTQFQDDAGPPHMLLRRLRMIANLFKASAVGGRQDNGGGRVDLAMINSIGVG